MASLRLTFPEKDEPTVIALTGARLTIGRLPFNTIQIIDRTVSGFHAELISEHGHYRLHDRGSSNGTFVNGQKVADYHLSDACTIMFGTVEAQFSPEAVPSHEEAENFPTRSEINAVRKENVELKATVEALREESKALRATHPVENGEASVPKSEFDKVVIEREGLKEERLKQEEEINRLKTDLAVLKRDRVNLQLAYDGLQREVTDLRAKVSGSEESALAPKAAAAALAAQAPSVDEEIRVEVPGAAARAVAGNAPTVAATPVTPKVPTTAPAVAKTPTSPIKPFAPAPKLAPAGAPPAPKPVATPAPAVASKPAEAGPTPAAPAAPVGLPKPAGPIGVPKPVAPLPKVPAAPVGMPKPGAPAKPGIPVNPIGMPKPAAPLPPAAKPGVPAKAPVGLGGASGLRPLGKPPVPANAAPIPPAPSENEDDFMDAPTAKILPVPKIGPKGTQKIT